MNVIKYFLYTFPPLLINISMPNLSEKMKNHVMKNCVHTGRKKIILLPKKLRSFS